MPYPKHAKKSSSAVRTVYRVPPGEKGYVDVALSGFNYDTTGSILLLNTVAQGAGVSQRIGKKWRMQSLEMLGLSNNSPSATVNQIRASLVYDRKPTGSLPAVTDIYESANSRSHRKEDNASRFQIIQEWSADLRGNATAGNSQNYTKLFNHVVNMKGKPVINKSAGTGAIGDIETGALYLVTTGNTAAGTTAASLNCAFRLRFQDM